MANRKLSWLFHNLLQYLHEQIGDFSGQVNKDMYAWDTDWGYNIVLSKKSEAGVGSVSIFFTWEAPLIKLARDGQG